MIYCSTYLVTSSTTTVLESSTNTTSTTVLEKLDLDSSTSTVADKFWPWSWFGLTAASDSASKLKYVTKCLCHKKFSVINFSGDMKLHCKVITWSNCKGWQHFALQPADTLDQKLKTRMTHFC